jgi:hypothetical protein
MLSITLLALLVGTAVLFEYQCPGVLLHWVTSLVIAPVRLLAWVVELVAGAVQLGVQLLAIFIVGSLAALVLKFRKRFGWAAPRIIIVEQRRRGPQRRRGTCSVRGAGVLLVCCATVCDYVAVDKEES